MGHPCHHSEDRLAGRHRFQDTRRTTLLEDVLNDPADSNDASNHPPDDDKRELASGHGALRRANNPRTPQAAVRFIGVSDRLIGRQERADCRVVRRRVVFVHDVRCARNLDPLGTRQQFLQSIQESVEEIRAALPGHQ